MYEKWLVSSRISFLIIIKSKIKHKLSVKEERIEQLLKELFLKRINSS